MSPCFFFLLHFAHRTCQGVKCPYYILQKYQFWVNQHSNLVTMLVLKSDLWLMLISNEIRAFREENVSVIALLQYKQCGLADFCFCFGWLVPRCYITFDGSLMKHEWTGRLWFWKFMYSYWGGNDRKTRDVLRCNNMLLSLAMIWSQAAGWLS